MEFPVWELRSFGSGLYPLLIHPLQRSNATLPIHLGSSGEELWANLALDEIVLVMCLLFNKVLLVTGQLLVPINSLTIHQLLQQHRRVMALNGHYMVSFGGF